jgi:hypothetical protein
MLRMIRRFLHRVKVEAALRSLRRKGLIENVQGGWRLRDQGKEGERWKVQ